MTGRRDPGARRTVVREIERDERMKVASLLELATMKPSPLTDYELLCHLIGRKTAKALYQGSLRAVMERSDVHNPRHEKLAIAWELMQRVLVEELRTAPVFESPSTVRQFLELFYVGRAYESFMVLFLDTHHRLIVAEEVFRGTLSQTSVYPREIVRQSLELNAAAVILAHNHPSGVAEPSRADEYLTASLKQALSLIDVRVIDHLIVGMGQTTSFSERGLL